MRIRDLANIEQKAQDAQRDAKFRECERKVRIVLTERFGIIDAEVTVVAVDGHMVLAVLKDDEFGELFFRLVLRSDTEPKHVHTYLLKRAEVEDNWYSGGDLVTNVRGLVTMLDLEW